MGRTRVNSYVLNWEWWCSRKNMAKRKISIGRSCYKMETIQSFRGPRIASIRFMEDWVLHVRKLRGCVATPEMLQLKAGEVARKNNIPVTHFKSSYGWVVRRKNLAIHKRVLCASNYRRIIRRKWCKYTDSPANLLISFSGVKIRLTKAILAYARHYSQHISYRFCFTSIIE